MHKKVIKIRVTMEPDLEEVAGHLRPKQRRELASKFDRWSHQLRFSAEVIEKDEVPKPPPRRLRFIPEFKLPRN